MPKIPLKCKESVRIKSFPPAMLRMLQVIHSEAQKLDCVKEILITSLNDSTHSPTSRHYKDEAVDLRTKNFPTLESKKAWVAQLASALGTQFTVLFEYVGEANEHIHIQPKKGTTYEG